MIRLTNAFAGTEKGKPVLINPDAMVSAASYFEGETRLQMSDGSEWLVSETIDQIEAALRTRSEVPMVDAYEREQSALHRQHMNEGADAARMTWLQEQIVDVIYLDDGRIIDVRGNSVRNAIDKARAALTSQKCGET